MYMHVCSYICIYACEICMYICRRSGLLSSSPIFPSTVDKCVKIMKLVKMQ